MMIVLNARRRCAIRQFWARAGGVVDHDRRAAAHQRGDDREHRARRVRDHHADEAGLVRLQLAREDQRSQQRHLVGHAVAGGAVDDRELCRVRLGGVGRTDSTRDMRDGNPSSAVPASCELSNDPTAWGAAYVGCGASAMWKLRSVCFPEHDLDLARAAAAGRGPDLYRRASATPSSVAQGPSGDARRRHGQNLVLRAQAGAGGRRIPLDARRRRGCRPGPAVTAPRNAPDAAARLTSMASPA